MGAPTSRRAFFRVAGRSLAVATATVLLAGCPGGGDDDDDGEEEDD
ncbi:MAG TPA: hypothetical protein VEY96_08260 [Actinomycetes bacterium]|nr:hypothetical protein [Actinomycetes bacterium]